MPNICKDYFSSVFIDEGEYTQGYNDKVNMDTGLGVLPSAEMQC